MELVKRPRRVMSGIALAGDGERMSGEAGGEGRAVVAHDRPALVRGVPEVLQVLDVAGRLGEPFDVRVVGPHEDVADADEVLESAQLVLVEGGDPDVAPERLARVLRVEERRLAEGLLELLEQVE